jgi:osmotically-inducible protein OsmY
MITKLKSIINQFLVIFILITIPATLSFAQQSESQLSKSNLKITLQYKLVKADLLQNNNINVDINDNSIILTGTVPTLYDKNEAEHIAQSVDENYAVVNRISVEDKAVEDSTLTKEIMSKIHSNIFYGVFDWLTVQSDNGMVTLGGWVHMPWLKHQFEAEVEKVPGVMSVINKIQTTFGPGELGYRAARLIYNDPMFWGQQYSPDPPIHIIVNNGSIYLFGDVSSSVNKSWAENILTFQTDAISVENDLKVMN